jgi:8-oxo-dGTP pyrophosphatase MutT (NUDIX family)
MKIINKKNINTENFNIHLSQNIMKKLNITAVIGLISPKSKKYVYIAVKNNRGWDLPGGHIEEGETPLDALTRELEEESGCVLLPKTRFLAILKSIANPHTGIVVYRGFCKVKRFIPKKEVKERKIIPKSEFLNIYFGNKELLRKLFNLMRIKT